MDKAPHEKLQVYRTARDLYIFAVKLAKKMSRDVRPTVGGRLMNDTFEIAMLVFRANVARDKVPFQTQIIELSAATNLLLRMCLEMRLISEKEYISAIELTNSVGRQANGWRKAQR